MVNKVRTYIEREALLPSPTDGGAGEKLFIALSGGADSTALLLIMKELGYRLHALHCNFHLRGEESERDQSFVEELCRRQQVPLSVRHFNTEEYAKEHGISIEMAAREQRYEWFNEELKIQKVKNEKLKVKNNSNLLEDDCNFNSSLFTFHFSLIAVAHHRDDQAETLLLNLLRGTGLRGLAGIKPKHEGIVRPLLCLSRDEILQYLESKGQAYVTDSTNSERIALRNRLRLDVMPLLRDINPAAIEHLCLACDTVRQSLPYYNKGIEAAFRELGITEDAFPLSPSHPLATLPLLHEWLRGKGFNRTQQEEMLKEIRSGSNGVGKMWHSVAHTVLRDRKGLLLLPFGEGAGRSLPSLRQEIVPCIGETGSGVAYFDADLLPSPIEVRPVREGDAFVPFGMKGRKLVSDFLTDRKLNRIERACQFVATCRGDIIWLIGHRSDNRYRVTEATTRILKLTIL